MDGLQYLAIILLIGRIVSVYFLWKIVAIQVKLLKLPYAEEEVSPEDEREAKDFRKRLYYMTLALLVGNIPSIILDIAVTAGVERTTPYLVVYAIFNMTTMFIAAIMIENMYRLAAQTQEVNRLELKHVRSQNKKN